MIDKLMELIDKLPPEVQGLAKVYGQVLERAGAEEVAKWIRDAILTDWPRAHTKLVHGMTTDEIVESQEATNELLREMNGENAAFLDAQRDAFLDLLIGAVALL